MALDLPPAEEPAKVISANRASGLPLLGFLFKDTSAFSKTQLAVFIIAFSLIGYVISRGFASAPLVASIEAEQMNLTSAGTIVNDSSASGGKAAALASNGVVSGTVNFPSSVTSLSVVAKGTQCAGSPIISVALDGVNLLSNSSVSSTAWANYSATLPSAAASGTHTLSMSGTNLGTVYAGKSGNVKCSRSLYIDVSKFYGPSTVTPLPTVTLSASPSSVSSGESSTLTWGSTNADTCTATGAWSGDKASSGSANTGALNQTSIYTLTCSGSGGSASASATVAVAAATASCPATIASGSFSGCYFNGTNFDSFVLARTDSSVDFTWPSGSSPASGVNSTGFSARWQGSFNFDAANYTFSMTIDDGARLYVDGNLVLDQWRDEYPTTYTASKAMTAGSHQIKLEYYNNAGGGTAKLSWAAVSTAPAPSGGTVLWTGDYETGNWSQWDEGGSHLQCDSGVGTASVQTSLFRTGRYAGKFTTNPYNGTNRSRCQTYLNQHSYYGNNGQENWFGLSFYIAPGSGLDTNWNNIESWHHASSLNELPAPFHYAVTNRGGVWTLRIDAWGGRWTSLHNGVLYGDQSHITGWNQYRKTFALNTLTAGKWYDVVLHIKWSPDPTVGFVESWVNGVKVLPKTFAATGYTDQYGNGMDPVYLKEGYDGGGVNAYTTVYHDSTVIAGDYAGAVSKFPAGSWPATTPYQYGRRESEHPKRETKSLVPKSVV